MRFRIAEDEHVATDLWLGRLWCLDENLQWLRGSVTVSFWGPNQ